MPEVRMSLVEASAALGIAQNSVRSRFKSGKIRGERDNRGRIWVWVDPASAPSKRRVSNSSIEPNIEVLKGHIETLTEQLSLANLELADLRPKAAAAGLLEVEAAGLRAQMDMVGADRDEWRRTAQAMIERPTSGFFGLFRRRFRG